MLSRWSFRINARDKYHNDRKRNACENIPAARLLLRQSMNIFFRRYTYRMYVPNDIFYTRNDTSISTVLATLLI